MSEYFKVNNKLKITDRDGNSDILFETTDDLITGIVLIKIIEQHNGMSNSQSFINYRIFGTIENTNVKFNIKWFSENNHYVYFSNDVVVNTDYYSACVVNIEVV